MFSALFILYICIFGSFLFLCCSLRLIFFFPVLETLDELSEEDPTDPMYVEQLDNDL